MIINCGKAVGIKTDLFKHRKICSRFMYHSFEKRRFWLAPPPSLADHKSRHQCVHGWHRSRMCVPAHSWATSLLHKLVTAYNHGHPESAVFRSTQKCRKLQNRHGWRWFQTAVSFSIEKLIVEQCTWRYTAQQRWFHAVAMGLSQKLVTFSTSPTSLKLSLCAAMT